MSVRVRTASQVKTWWSLEDFDYTVKTLNNCYQCNTGGHIRRDCPSRGQPRLTYSEKDFDFTVNLLGHCWKCNPSGHVRVKFPKLGKSLDYLLLKRTRKEHKSLGVVDKFKRIFWKVMKKNKWKPEDLPVMETKEEGSISLSIDGVHSEPVKPGENHVTQCAFFAA